MALARRLLPAGFTLLQVTPALDAGGVETLTVDVAAAAAAAGARSLVASRGGQLEGELARVGGELIRLPVQARDPLSLLANAVRLERLIRRERVSLVHVRSRAPAFSALAAARRARVPIVATYHGIYSARSPLKRWYNSVMTRGDAVIANSAFTRDHILSQHGVSADKVSVIPEGVDTAVFDPAAVAHERVAAVREAWGLAPGDSREVILVAARLSDWKGHRCLIAAMGLAAGRERARLVFTGGGEANAYARQLASEAAAAGVELHIAGPCADMPAAFLAADFVAAPSTQPESFGRAIAEAGAMERVVIASRLGGPAETIADGETGWLVAPGDTAAWAAAVDRTLVMSEADRAAMGAAARRRVIGAFSLDAMCEATFALYRRLTEA
jgi:glycosyltransferase involved in cell wall biosynthesis